jgi:hypothetical protein
MSDRAWAKIEFAQPITRAEHPDIFEALENPIDPDLGDGFFDAGNIDSLDAFEELVEEEAGLMICEHVSDALLGTNSPAFCIEQAAKYEFDGTEITYVPGVGVHTNHAAGDGSPMITGHELRQWIEEPPDQESLESRIRNHFGWVVTDAWAALYKADTERRKAETVTPSP